MIQSVLSAPQNASRKTTTTDVTEIPFDRGDEYYTGDDGKLASRPATRGLIMLNLKTLQASEEKIQAIQNRVDELTKSGVPKQPSGDFSYTDAATGESVKVENKGGVTVYEQSFVTKDAGWLTQTEEIHTERFEVSGNEVNVKVREFSHEHKEAFGWTIPRTTDESDTTMSFKYAKGPDGLKYYHSDEWHIAK